MIKLFGLYSAVTTILSVLPANIIFSLGYLDIGSLIWIAGTVGVTFGLFWLLTFKAEKIVEWLKLEKGFTADRIELGNIKGETIVKTGTFIIGGLLMIKHIPAVLSQIYWAFKGDIVGQEFTPKDKISLTISIINVIVGYLLFANYQVVAKKLSRK